MLFGKRLLDKGGVAFVKKARKRSRIHDLSVNWLAPGCRKNIVHCILNKDLVLAVNNGATSHIIDLKDIFADQPRPLNLEADWIQ